MGLFKKKKKAEEPDANENIQAAAENSENNESSADTPAKIDDAVESESNESAEDSNDTETDMNTEPETEKAEEEPEEEVMQVEYVTREDPALKTMAIERETPEHPLHETDKIKYLDTMWFTQETLTYINKKEKLEFEVTVYPLADGPDGYPVPIIAAIRRSNVFKTMISGENLSVSLVYEGLLINCTGFFKDGQFDSRVSVTQTDGGKVSVKSENKQKFSGSILPNNFGKKMFIGADSIEIFPMAVKNDKSTGCVHFLWVQQKANGDVFYGSSDQQQKARLDFTKEGVKTIIAYWTKTDEHDNSRAFINVGIT